jgi:pimeloyl-ACP methyl ester carboxylesterase
MRRGYADIPSGQIHYVEEGQGECVLLLHQSPLSVDEYKDVIPILGKEYRVLAMDTPGYGGSAVPPSYIPIEEYAKRVLYFLDAVGISAVSVVGSHTGAAIAVEVAVSAPERVVKLILNGCPDYEPEVRKSRLIDSKYDPINIAPDGSHLIRIWQIAQDWSPNFSPESWHRWVVDFLNAGELDAHQALFRYLIDKRLPLLKMPTLLITGTEDVFYHRLMESAELIPDCKTKIIEGGGIVIGYERAKEFAKTILEFLREKEDGKG